MKTTSEATSDAPAMSIDHAMARVAELDFTMLKRKLALQKGWSAEFIAEVEQFYRQFLP